MKLFKNNVIFAFVACCAALFAGACTDDDGIDNRESDYGYVQFKLYKEGLEPVDPSTDLKTRAVDELDYLSDACKLEIRLLSGDIQISQTLTLNYADKESAEFGLRSDKLQLLAGEYQIVSYILYDVLDNELYRGTTENNMLTVVAGGLTSHNLTAKVTPRGKVRFNVLKDISEFKNMPGNGTRALDRKREYMFDEIAYFDVIIHEVGTSKENITYSKLKADFSIHFDEDDVESDEFGYQTSSISCDSLFSLPAATYEIVGYATYDTNKDLLEECSDKLPEKWNFTVEDNKTTEANVSIKLYEADEYMKDNYALREIWLALDGPNWYYGGQDYNKGCNWDFNKSPDLWSDQPGVEIHSNGRVAKLVLSEFGISGKMPKALGQLTELVELYLGTHNDTNTGTYDPMLDQSKSLEERNRNRMEYNKQYMQAIHPMPQMSYPCALALKENGLTSPAMALYEQGYTEQELIDAKTGRHLEIEPKDVIAGRFCNNLESLPAEIGNLTKLEYLYLGNSPIKELPKEIGKLSSCTLLEIYNCPYLNGLPDEVKDMPALVQVNISCNAGTSTIPGWEDQQLQRTIRNLATGNSKNVIQMLYVRDNNLTSIPKEIAGMERLGLLDLSNNKISGEVEAFGNDFMPSELYFDNNQITKFKTVATPDGKRQIFCNTDNLDTFSASYNQLTEVPDIFTSDTPYYLSGVNLAYNKIEGFENGKNGKYQGINVTTFTLSGNQIKEYPACMVKSNSQISYIILSGNGMTSFEKDCFTPTKPENLANLISIDLTYNRLTELPDDFHAGNLPYLYGVDFSYNAFSKFPWNPTDALSLTVYAVRGQRADDGSRCLREWPTGIYKHTGLRGLFLGSNDLRKIDDTISYLIYNLDISDNPNITFDASDICYYWQAGAFNLTYDKSQNIINCPAMLE
ncbi:MAG TPA: DUF4458 domain-containing protein [Candidatus Alistipes intestinipullorum]|nr:DUF4458 domain-containing protein [Candidatus Alistipes intestinipullorum]